ncbi:Cytosine deaminase [Pseudomonas syringae pv. maculicola]|nr:Cytosine deaminase [Pseudomonas syringae pv. maculicola]
MAVDHVVRQAEFEAQTADFVLEQLAQGLDQLEVHFFRQAAHVVVRLDDVSLAAFRASRLDHVRVDGALRQVLDVVQLAGFGIEHVDEGAADDLALFLWIALAFQVVQELFFGVGTNDFDAHVLGEHGHHLLAFVQAQQAVVDEYTGQLIADGFVQQRRDYGGVNAAGQAQQHAISTHLSANLSDSVFSNLRRGPQCFAAADIEDEARQDATALLGVGHFRVELHAVVTASVVSHTGNRAARGTGQNVEVFRQFGDLVTVTHPYVEAKQAVGVDMVFDTIEQTAFADYVNASVAELAQLGTRNLAAQLLGHGLHAVADTENRHTEVKYRLRAARAVGFVHGLGAAGEDHAFWSEFANRFVVHVKRMQLAIHADFTHAAGDQLGVLGAEVEDQDTVGVNVEGHGNSLSSCKL